MADYNNPPMSTTDYNNPAMSSTPPTAQIKSTGYANSNYAASSMTGYPAAPLTTGAYRPFGTSQNTGGMRNMVGSGELKTVGFAKAVLAEFLATTALLWIGVAAIVWGTGNFLTIAFAWGIAYFILTYATQHVSGGYMNPAATLALMIVGKLPIIRGICYWIAQFLGALVGAGLVKAVSFGVYNSTLGGANVNLSPFTKGGALMVEIICTLIFVFTILASVDVGYGATTFGSHINILSPLAVGLAYFVLFLISLPVDGGCMNPVRAWGPAVIINRHAAWADHWIFWVGPIIGAVGAALIYEIFFRHSYIPFQRTSGDANVAPGPVNNSMGVQAV